MGLNRLGAESRCLPVNRVAWKQALEAWSTSSSSHALFQPGKNLFKPLQGWFLAEGAGGLGAGPISVQNVGLLPSLPPLSLSWGEAPSADRTEQPFFLLTKQQKMSLDLRLARSLFSSRWRCGHANKSISGALDGWDL